MVYSPQLTLVRIRQRLVEALSIAEAKMLQANSYTAGGKTIAFKDPCDYFHEGKAKASTLSLSVLVSIEMFNALNALSEVTPTFNLSNLLP